MLSLLIWIPALGAAVISLLPQRFNAQQVRWVALATMAVTLFFASIGMILFDPTATAIQFQEVLTWIEPLGLTYHLGLDGLSLPLVILNLVLVTVAIWSSNTQRRVRLYYCLILLLSVGVTGAFATQNLLLFFLFYEVELLPLYLLIAIWGGSKRGYAATKFLIYTALSGLLLLVAFFALAWLSPSHSFDYQSLQNHPLPLNQQLLILIPLFIGLAIKIPVVPFHTWLPDAHVEASTPVSVLLAGILLKLGTYGLLRFGLGFLGDAWKVAGPWIALFAVINVLYGSFNALAQKDMKKMVAYGSVAHMGYILLAAAAATPLSTLATILQMVSHGLISALLFLLVGATYANTGTRDLGLLRGLLNLERGLPLVGSLMIMAVMASAGTPGMVGFVAEFMVFRSSFVVFPWQTLVCMLGTGLTAAYFLLLVNRAFFGRLSSQAINMPRRTLSEQLPATVLAILIVLFGLNPNWIVQWSETSARILANSGSIG